MRYLNCPHCGLSAALSEQWLVADHCPRCVANTRTLVNLVVSAARPADASWSRLAVARTDGTAGV
jgi:Zn-finger nucleic acid-binding protein